MTVPLPPSHPLPTPHPLQLLAPKYFLKWKQRHQVKYRFSTAGLDVSCTHALLARQADKPAS